MKVQDLSAVLVSPLARPSQRRSRENAARASFICALRRAEREDVEAFLTRVLPEQQRRRMERRST